MAKRYWTVLATKQASSEDARRHVGQQGFEHLHLLFRHRPERGVRRILPLFPYYLLVRINPRKDNWKALASTKGVRSIFQNGSGLSVVPDSDIEYFRSLHNELGYFEHPEHVTPRFTSGETVRGTSGLFADCEGIYQGLAGSTIERVRVLFTILGQPKVMELKAFDLVSAAA